MPINRLFRETHTSAGRGLIRNSTPGPCMAQATHRRPPFFPLRGRYADSKWSEIDPQIASTWAMIKTYLAGLRGNNRPVP